MDGEQRLLPKPGELQALQEAVEILAHATHVVAIKQLELPLDDIPRLDLKGASLKPLAILQESSRSASVHAQSSPSSLSSFQDTQSPAPVPVVEAIVLPQLTARTGGSDIEGLEKADFSIPPPTYRSASEYSARSAQNLHQEILPEDPDSRETAGSVGLPRTNLAVDETKASVQENVENESIDLRQDLTSSAEAIEAADSGSLDSASAGKSPSEPAQKPRTPGSSTSTENATQSSLFPEESMSAPVTEDISIAIEAEQTPSSRTVVSFIEPQAVTLSLPEEGLHTTRSQLPDSLTSLSVVSGGDKAGHSSAQSGSMTQRAGQAVRESIETVRPQSLTSRLSSQPSSKSSLSEDQSTSKEESASAEDEAQEDTNSGIPARNDSPQFVASSVISTTFHNLFNSTAVTQEQRFASSSMLFIVPSHAKAHCQDVCMYWNAAIHPLYEKLYGLFRRCLYLQIVSKPSEHPMQESLTTSEISCSECTVLSWLSVSYARREEGIEKATYCQSMATSLILIGTSLQEDRVAQSEPGRGAQTAPVPQTAVESVFSKESAIAAVKELLTSGLLYQMLPNAHPQVWLLQLDQRSYCM